eukprot:GHVT01029898.1.p1 GENE.GHVT01029898.1~~GHVT01029898.1.p1  ORF type:complete len:132 (-),score=13.67 GHVT01029898.1:654-1049(-)
MALVSLRTSSTSSDSPAASKRIKNGQPFKRHSHHNRRKKTTRRTRKKGGKRAGRRREVIKLTCEPRFRVVTIFGKVSGSCAFNEGAEVTRKKMKINKLVFSRINKGRLSREKHAGLENKWQSGSSVHTQSF